LSTYGVIVANVHSLFTENLQTILVKVKVKVKYSLCLTKYHAMKTYPALIKAPLHEDERGEWRYGSTHSYPGYLMDVSGQLHAPTALPPGNELPAPI
jgi:hypothetical protein